MKITRLTGYFSTTVRPERYVISQSQMPSSAAAVEMTKEPLICQLLGQTVVKVDLIDHPRVWRSFGCN